MPVTIHRLFRIAGLLLLFGTNASPIEYKKKKANSGPLFGSKVCAAGALRGNVYHLVKGTSWLPDFTRLRPTSVVCTTSLNYILQPMGDEWFAIDYAGTFYVSRPGNYRFQLTSDDGAQLFIDGKRIINNDGVHAAQSEDGTIRLEAGAHQIRVPYFQGPQPYVALILDVQLPGGKLRTFNTDDFRPPSETIPSEERPTLKRK